MNHTRNSAPARKLVCTVTEIETVTRVRRRTVELDGFDGPVGTGARLNLIQVIEAIIADVAHRRSRAPSPVVVETTCDGVAEPQSLVRCAPEREPLRLVVGGLGR